MKKVLLFFIICTNITFVYAQQPIKIISINFNSEKDSLKTVFKECIGAGRANEGLRADWQAQLTQVKKELGFKYIRMHGLLHDDMGVYFEDKQGNSVYNFQYIDALYDFLISINIKPFVELSFMPETLASGDKTVFWWEANVTPPKDYKKWYNLINSLVQHLTGRYGEEEVKTWYFEVWNEPNHPSFWSSDMNEYFKLYDNAAQAIKNINSDYKVGGPATAGNSWIKEIIEHCANNNIPIDFVSTHAYAVEKGFFDETGETGTVLSPRLQAIISDVKGSAKKIDESSKPGLELHYTEWSASYTPTDPIHDSYHEAAFILDKLKATESLTTSMSYWTFSDIFEENGPRISPFHGGFGLMNYQGIKKPAYFAYEYLNQLGNTELNNNDNASWFCKNSQGDIQGLFWDFTITHPGDSIINQVFYKLDLPSKTKGDILVKISEIPAGTYLLEEYKTGYRTNDPYSTYLDIGSPVHLSKVQAEVIKKANDNNPLETKIVIIKEDGLFQKRYPIKENDVLFIKLIKL